jgi:hypothetical protein
MIDFNMIKRCLVLASALVLAACATPPKTMYYWEDFPKRQYDSLLHDNLNAHEQLVVLRAVAEKASAHNGILPPGFRAHMGMLELVDGNPAAARDLWNAEKAAFPESKPYIDQLIKKLEDQVKPSTAASAS